jgi:cell division protein FtsX
MNILRCTQANEIQDQWQPQIADTYYLKDNIRNIHTKIIEETIKKESYISTQKGV